MRTAQEERYYALSYDEANKLANEERKTKPWQEWVEICGSRYSFYVTVASRDQLTLWERKAKNNPSYSGCMNCGDAWNWKMHHSVQIDPVMSIFTHCEECWRASSEEERSQAMHSLMGGWMAECPDSTIVDRLSEMDQATRQDAPKE